MSASDYVGLFFACARTSKNAVVVASTSISLCCGV